MRPSRRGAGKAEPEVVEQVCAVEASCFILDLGKSYGFQTREAYTAMLERIRSSHRDIPLVCVTPVFATREWYDAEYVAISRHTREVVRGAVADRIGDGDRGVFLVEGLELLGSQDSDGFSPDGVHPSDLGHARIAERLQERMASLGVL
ncbi:MAG: hypothetical protein EXS64_16710 [Candidatus Latescibacteria bacterium]|nr:hypothetical protein [Candidatus Latescibacterota bacterium]